MHILKGEAETDTGEMDKASNNKMKICVYTHTDTHTHHFLRLGMNNIKMNSTFIYTG